MCAYIVSKFIKATVILMYNCHTWTCLFCKFVVNKDMKIFKLCIDVIAQKQSKDVDIHGKYVF